MKERRCGTVHVFRSKNHKKQKKKPIYGDEENLRVCRNSCSAASTKFVNFFCCWGVCLNLMMSGER